MRTQSAHFQIKSVMLALVSLLILLPFTVSGQDRLPSMPGYQQHQKMANSAKNAVKLGSVYVTWREGGKSFDYEKDGKTYRHTIATGKTEEIGKAKQPAIAEDDVFETGPLAEAFPQKVERGRQKATAPAPNGKHMAIYRDCNIWLGDGKGNNATPITVEGDAKKRIKFGIASWVYGEELKQTTAMWWSPDSKKFAFYRFDESKVPDYNLPLKQSSLRPTIDVEAYPKPGDPNPIADLVIYDVETKRMQYVDVRDGKPFENSVVGHYVYGVAWSGDGKELYFNRANRRQNIVEWVAANPETGKCRLIIKEEWPTGWVNNHRTMTYLKDRNRFIWTSERNGFKNFYLYDLSGKLHATLTNHNFDTAGIVRVDEQAGYLYYMARSGDNHMKQQLHRVGLDGKGDKRFTDPAWHHSVDIAPDGQHFIDIIETHDTPPSTRLVNANGKVLTELAKSDMSVFDKRGIKRVELITYKAGDGVTDLHGMLHFPSNFDPSKKYPLLVSVYGGPGRVEATEKFSLPNAMAEYGFLYAKLDSRSASGRGKKFIDSIYMKLGVTEIDDQAAGVKSLWNRPYLNKSRVGIYGTSYGGYASAMALLRHPDAFYAASASSPVTAWEHYDSIYTERYMWIPQENKAGYKAGSAMNYANNLKGRLLLYYGTEDNNVHPSNTLALITALQRAGKGFEVQVGPDKGHTGVNQARMMEFFIENLVMRQ